MQFALIDGVTLRLAVVNTLRVLAFRRRCNLRNSAKLNYHSSYFTLYYHHISNVGHYDSAEETIY